MVIDILEVINKDKKEAEVLRKVTTINSYIHNDSTQLLDYETENINDSTELLDDTEIIY